MNKFQSRNRESSNFNLPSPKRAFVCKPFQSRNRESSNFNDETLADAQQEIYVSIS